MYRQKHLVLLFLGPALATYLIFIVYPFISSFHYSLFNWNGIGPLNDYVGLGNYAYVLFLISFPVSFGVRLHTTWCFS